MSCALLPFEIRNQHKVLIGCFPQHLVDKFIERTSNAATIRKEYRAAFEEKLFSAFDQYNQIPFTHEKFGDTPFLLSFLAAVSDHPEGCQCCNFAARYAGAHRSEYSCRVCIIPSKEMNSTVDSPWRDLDSIIDTWDHYVKKASSAVESVASTTIDDRHGIAHDSTSERKQHFRVNTAGYHSEIFLPNSMAGVAAKRFAPRDWISDDSFKILQRYFYRFGSVVDRVPMDFMHTVAGIVRFVLVNTVLLVKSEEAMWFRDGDNETKEWASVRLNRLNERLCELSLTQRYNYLGERMRALVKCDIDELTGVTCADIMSYVPLLLAAINTQQSEFMSRVNTQHLRQVLLTLDRIIDLQKLTVWSEEDLDEFRTLARDVGPQLHKMTQSLEKKAGSDVSSIIKPHSLIHLAEFVPRFGTPRVTDSSVSSYKSEHINDA